MRAILLFILAISFLGDAAYASGEARIVDIRAGVHKDFHRLVIELSDTVKYELKRDGNRAYLLMHGTGPGYSLKGLKSAGNFKVAGLGSKDGAAVLDIELKGGAEVKGSVSTAPFRIVLDIYPVNAALKKTASVQGSAPSPKKSQKNQKITPKSPIAGRNPKGAPEETVKGEVTDNRMAAFNDGWRWAYRKKAVSSLKKDIDDSEEMNSVFRGEAGLGASDAEGLAREAVELAAALKTKGDERGGAALEGITLFFAGKTDAEKVEEILISGPDGAFTRLGYFLLGNDYEKRGFYPEALGYYSRIINDRKDTPVSAEALFRKGRLLYFDGKNDGAREFLAKAADKGHLQARLWLANAWLLKGDSEKADAYYRSAGSLSRGAVDPVTYLSMADLDIIKKDYGSARAKFTELKAGHSKDEFLSVFFEMRSADALLSEGRKQEATAIYNKLRDRLHTSDELAMISLAFADFLSMSGEREALLKAEKVYKEIMEGEFTGTEVACLNVIPVEIRLGKFEEALKNIETFPAVFPTSALRQDVQAWKGALVIRWMDDLYAARDYYGVVRIYSRHKGAIPFGRKAEALLKAGKAYAEAGLLSDAANSLDNAARIGKNGVAEEAMIELARVYLSQGDIQAAERMIAHFTSRFPRTRFVREAEEISMKTAYIGGDYRKVTEMRNTGDPGLQILKAASLFRLQRFKESEAAYSEAARLSMEKGDSKGQHLSFIGYADSNFMMRDYPAAAEGYRKAIEVMRDEGGSDKSWALYRLAQCYSILKRNPERDKAVEELKVMGNDFGKMAMPVFKTSDKNL